MDLGLTDRVYVVAGASRGLGRACAQQLVTEGARLVLSGRDEEALAATAESLGGPERAIAVSGDLGEAGLETCLAAAAIARYGRLDGALLSLGRPEPGTVSDTDDGQWRLSFESLFLGALRLARAVARNVSHEGGSVLFLLPRAGYGGPDARAVETALCGTVVATARAMCAELGPRPVRVNTLVPGHVESPSSREADEAAQAQEAVPLRRFGEPLEFARPAVFLLSPAASYVSGAVLTVDGGLTRPV